MPKVHLSNADVFYLHIYSKEECDHLFGEDYLEEYGIEISDELLARALAARTEWRAVQKELAKIKRDAEAENA